MLALILTLILIALAVGILCALGAVILQGYWYESVADGIAWRSAATGAASGVVLGLWGMLEAAVPGRFDTLLNFSPRESMVFDQFWSVRKSDRGTTEELYKRSRDLRGVITFVDANQRPWQRSDGGMMVAVIVEENGERKRFDAELDAAGRFLVRDSEPLRYREVGGSRVMTEAAIGQLHTMRYGRLIVNLVWNLLHLAAWFACFWLILEFQWPHAVLLAAVMWLVTVVIVWPVLQERLRAVVSG